MENLVIRLGNKKDVEQISKLWFQMVNELRPDWKPNINWWKKMCYALLDMKDFYSIAVAEIKGEIVGFMDGLAFPEPSTGKLHGVAQHFYILPKYRKSNVALKLYRYVLRLAQERKVEIFEFFCFSDNKDFWSKKGYKEIRTMMRRNYV